ncbi:TPA: hypothetical protein HA278_06370, partial [Candidatus Woesearchaeota archaeon]|nr:hypothetical protein [Candidatus Woesearchaeota archaeon]
MIQLLALLGIVVGYFIGSMTKDELRVGRKWFLLTKNILFWILIAAVT